MFSPEKAEGVNIIYFGGQMDDINTKHPINTYCCAYLESRQVTH